MNRKINVDSQKSTVPLFYGLFLTVFMSRMAWYDLRTISAASSEESNLQTYFILWSVCLVPFIGYHLIRGLRFGRDLWLPNILLLLGLYSTLTGLLFENSFLYIMQDLFKYMFIPSVIYATYFLPKRVSAITVLRFIATVILVFYLARIAIFIFFNSSGRIYYGTPQDLFAVCVNVAFLVCSNGRINFPVTIGKLGIMSLLTAIGQKKTLAIGIVFVFLMAGASALFRMQLRGMVRLLILIFAITGLGIFTFVGTDINLDRYMAADIERELGVDSRRNLEVSVALGTLENTGLSYIFGLGGGATLNVPKVDNGRVELSETHSIHNTSIALLTRSGVFGVFVLLYVLLFGIGWSFRNLTSKVNEHALLANTAIFYKFFAFMASFVIYGLIDDVILGLLAGLILRVDTSRKTTVQRKSSNRTKSRY